MAFTAREVIMTFRGQNYLSGAIRRIGSDVGGLSRTANLSNQRAMLQARAAQLNYARSTAQAELFSVQNGTRALSLQRARVQLSTTEQRNVAQLHSVESALYANRTKQLQVQERINAAQRAQSAGVPFVGRGMARQQTSVALRIQQQDMERLQQEAAILNERYITQNQVVGQASLRAQQLAARESELVQREAQLQQAILARTRAIDENTLAQMRNDFEASRIAPVQTWEQRAASIEHAGRALQMFGLIGTAAVGAAADSAAKFNSQFTLAATQARPPGASASATANIANNIQRQVMDLMQRFPATASEMADSFYQIFSGTNIQNVKQATDAVRVFNQMAVAGGTNLKTMTDAGISLYNNFGGLHGEFKTLTDAGNAFFAAVRYGRMNAEQFAASLPNVVGIAKSVGLSFNDIAGAMATLTRQTGGKFTSRDATGIARMIEIFARPDFVAGAKKFGVNIKDAAGNMRPLLDIISEFAEKTKGMDRIDLINLFKQISGLGSTSGHGGTAGTIQARRAFQYLITDISNYRNVSELVRTDNNELSKSFEAMSKTPGIQWAIFVNRLKVLVYEIGTQAIPAFIKLGEPVAKAVNWFNGLNDNTKHVIATFLTFASAGLLITGVLSSIGGGLARVVAQFVIMSRMRSLEKLMIEARAAQTLAPAAGVGTSIINPRTGAAFSETEAGIATTAAATAGAEAGFIRAGTALRLGLIGALVVGIPVILKYHDAIERALTGTTGLTGVTKLLGIALAGIGIAQAIKLIDLLITRLALLKTAEEGAAGAGLFAGGFARLGAAVSSIRTVGLVASLRTALPLFARSALGATALRGAFVSLAGAPFLVQAAVGIAGYELSKFIRKIPFWEQGMRSLGGAIYGIFHGGGGQHGALATGAQTINIQSQVDRLRLQGLTQAQVDQRIKTAYPELDPANIDKTVQIAFNRLSLDLSQRPLTFADMASEAAMKAARAPAATTNATTPRATVATLDATKFATMTRQVNQIVEAETKANQTHLAADWLRYYTLLGTFQGKWKNNYLQVFNQLLQQSEDAMKNRGTLSDAAVMNQVKNINALFRTATKHPTLANWENYYKALNNLQTNASDTQMNAAQQFLQTSQDVTKQAKNQQKNLEQISQNYKTMIGTIQSSFQQFQQQNQQNLGTLFQGPVVTGARMQNNLQFGGKVTGRDLLQDLRAQVSKFRQFRRVLSQLSRRGAPAALIQQINQMGPDALDEARALLSLDQQDFRAYTRVFREGQTVVESATKMDMTRQLRQWRSFGKNIARQILLGLKEEGSPTESYFRGLLTSLGISPRVPGPGGKNPQYVQYVYNGGTMDYSTWLRKSKLHYKQRGK